jgi:AcrR family transcriptional regulator
MPTKGKIRQKKAPKRARGRPREFDVDEALDQAMGVFWSKGYHAASIDDLCDAMQIGRPSLYSAFIDKETLFLKVVDRYASTLAAEPIDAFRRASTLNGAYTAFFEATLFLTVGHVPNRGCLIGCCLADAAGTSEVFQKELIEKQKRTHEILSRSISERGATYRNFASELALSMQMLSSGLAVEARSGVQKAELRMRVQAAIATMSQATRGMAKRTELA